MNTFLKWFRRESSQPEASYEQYQDRTQHDNTENQSPEHGAFSNKSEPSSPETKSELPKQKSNLVSRLGKRKRPSDDVEEELAELKHQLATRDETIAELRSQRDRLQEHVAFLEASYEEELADLKLENQAYEAEIGELQDEVVRETQRLTEEKEDCEEQLRKAQESAFRQMKAGRWVPREDSSIRSDLRGLEGKIRNWARTYSWPDMRCFDWLSPRDISQIEGVLHKGICASTQSASATIKLWPARHKVPMLLVHAVIARSIFQEIFHRPFYLFDKRRSTTQEKPGSWASHSLCFGTDLERLYEKMQHIDHREAHVWRSQTHRLLQDAKEIQETSVAVCQDLAKTILDGPILKLCLQVSPEDQRKRERDLIELFVGAGRLAQEFWTQRTYMEIVDKECMKTFHIDSPLMTAHRLQQLDEDDHRLDGHEILAVIQPALVAYGNDDGENYECHKVWSKALVLVAE